ncbi:hypothetical protein [Streptomyces parvulus]|uniref:hypothetical protein n=1 Tax=Streptomyces parvulus TaxID=146923 RepID=UPI0036B8E9AB
MMPADDDPVLDDPVSQSLVTRHAHLARRLGRAATSASCRLDGRIADVDQDMPVLVDPSPTGA